jgi:hypothetical protein
VEFLGETVRGEAEGFHELCQENLAGMDGEGKWDFVHGLLDDSSFEIPTEEPEKQPQILHSPPPG